MEYSQEGLATVQEAHTQIIHHDEQLMSYIHPKNQPDVQPQHSGPSIPVPVRVLRSTNNNAPLTCRETEHKAVQTNNTTPEGSQSSSTNTAMTQTPEAATTIKRRSRSLSKKIPSYSSRGYSRSPSASKETRLPMKSSRGQHCLKSESEVTQGRKRSKSPSRRRSRSGARMETKKRSSPRSEDSGKVVTPSALTFFITYFVTGVNQGCMFIYVGMMPFLYKQYGMDPVTFGYVMSAAAFLTLCSSPILGRVADTVGSRTVLILCMLSASAAHFSMAVAGNVTMLIVSRALGLLMDCMPAAQMTVTDLAPEADRGRYLGKIMIPMSAGMIVGPTLGGFLSKYFGSQGTLMLTWIAPLICILIILTFIPHQKKQVKVKTAKKGGINWERLGELMGKGDIPRLFVLRVLSTLPGMLFMMNFQLAGVTFFKLTPQGNGMVVSCLGIMNMINNWYTLGFLAKYFTPNQLLKMAPVLSVFTYFLLSQVTDVWQLVVMLFFINLCYAIMENQVMTRLTRSVDSKDTSTMVGLGTALFQASKTLSPTLGGVLMQNYGFPAIGATGTAVSVLMALAALTK